MDMIVDLVLLAVSGVAAFYCAVLHQRLGRLMDADKGIGAGVAAMSHTLDQTQAVLQAARDGCRLSVDELTPLLEDARTLADRLAELTDVASEMTDLATGDIERAAARAIRAVEAAARPAAERGRPHRGAPRCDAADPALADRIRSNGLEHLLG